MKHEHSFKPVKQDGDLSGDIRSEVREYSNPNARWEDYLLLYCTKCGEVKKTWIKEVKSE